MKLAGVLALILAAVVGIWAGVDYAQNEQERQFEVQQMTAAIECCDAVFKNATMEEEKAEQKEHFDGVIGIVAAGSLIGGIALLSRGKKAAA